MKKSRRFKGVAVACFTAVLILAGFGTAMAFGHYTPGSLGLNAASLPPPGFHYSIYNTFYSADDLNDDSGNPVNNGFDLDVFASAHQFTYITGIKILGADFGFDAVVPLVNTDIKMLTPGGRIAEDTFGIGDLYFEPFVLAWHYPRGDVSVAWGFYVPTGESKKPSSPGRGYWSFMETLGGTYYFDPARTLSFSVLTRWLQNTRDDDTQITPGADMVAEYGIAKAFPFENRWMLTLGLAGYTYKQLADDSGDSATGNRFFGNAAGPEIRCMFFKPFPFQLSLRYLFEYGVKNGSEGKNICLTLIGSF